MKKNLAPVVLLLLCVFFIAAGCAFIYRLGIQNDEVFFASALYQPLGYRWGVKLFGSEVPVMLLSYLGATKAWFYAGLFALMPRTLFTLRFPMLLGGALAIVLFYGLLRRISGERAAVIGALLLATDAIFVLVTLWGPIVSHHLLFLGAMLAFVEFHRTGSRRWLACAAFLCGFALWDKALFLWLLSGMALGAVAAFPRALRKRLSWSNLRTVALWGSLGALPLLAFNYRFKGETLRGNSSWTFSEWGVKARAMRTSLDGSMLFGWLVADEIPPKLGEPRNAVERAAMAVSGLTGHPEVGLLPWACLAALVLAPLWWGSPARPGVVFAVVLFGVAWVQMAITRNAGGAAHHTLLLWPLPQMVVALVLAEVSLRLGRAGRVVACLAMLAVAVPNVLILNEYLARAVRTGPARNFTDAIFPLAETLRRVPATSIYLADWGMVDSLRFLGGGRFPLALLIPMVSQPATPADERDIRGLMARPEVVFVGHTPPMEFYPGAGARLREFAARNGFRTESLAVVSDSFARPVYEIYHFRPAEPK